MSMAWSQWSVRYIFSARESLTPGTGHESGAEARRVRQGCVRIALRLYPSSHKAPEAQSESVGKVFRNTNGGRGALTG